MRETYWSCHCVTDLTYSKQTTVLDGQKVGLTLKAIQTLSLSREHWALCMTDTDIIEWYYTLFNYTVNYLIIYHIQLIQFWQTKRSFWFYLVWWVTVWSVCFTAYAFIFFSFGLYSNCMSHAECHHYFTILYMDYCFWLLLLAVNILYINDQRFTNSFFYEKVTGMTR